MPRAAFFCGHAYAGTMPFILEPLRRLAAEGFEIDFYAPALEGSPPPTFGDATVTVRDFGLKAAAAPGLASALLGAALKRRYDLIMANPVGSLVYAALLATASRTPLVAFSDELWTEADFPLGPRTRRLMDWAHSRAALTLIVDAARAEALRASTGLPSSHTILELPNCPAGAPGPISRDEQRARLGIPAGAVAVLYSGAWVPRWGIERVFETIPLLPEGSCLVVQLSKRPLRPVPTLAGLVSGAYPVRFLLEPCLYDEVDLVVGSCDIGIALYDGDGPNDTLCGKGSGKVCRHLRLGKPVIVSPRSGLDWVAERGAGELAGSPPEIAQAIGRISADYAAYSARALECYREEVAFERFFPPVRAALAELIRQPPRRGRRLPRTRPRPPSA